MFALLILSFALFSGCCRAVPQDLALQQPQLVSVDLQDNFTDTLATVAVGDFFQSSLYTEASSGDLLQRVYWRNNGSSEYRASGQEFRKYDFNASTANGDTFEASTLSDVAATAMGEQGSVLYVIATSSRELQVYILSVPPAPLDNLVIEALNTTLVEPTSCASANDSDHVLLVDVECDWHLTNSSGGGSSVECFVFALECGTLHTYRFDGSGLELQETNCTHFEYDYTRARHIQVEVPSFPSESPSGVLLTNVLVSTISGDASLNETERPVWSYVAHVCDPALPAPNATLSIDVRTFERSSLAADDAGALVLRTQLNSTRSLGAFRTWALIASPFVANHVEFFDPIDRTQTLVSQDTGFAGIINRLCASHTDYPQQNLDALFVLEFFDPLRFVLSASFSSQGATFRSTTTLFTTLSEYDDRTLDMGTVYELDDVAVPRPLVATSLFGDGGSDVLLLDFVALDATIAPTASPTPSPLTLGTADEPIRYRTGLPMPNSVIGGSLMHAECANNTWVREGADEHCDACEPFAGLTSNNNSKPLWFSFETQHEPAAYLIYTDPSGPQCSECCAGLGKSAEVYDAAPLLSSVVSLWSHCYYEQPVAGNGIDACSSDPVPGMQEEHGFLGPRCLPPNTVHKVRVRGNTAADVGDFDITVEEWSLRRGGDRCSSARALDFIELGVNDASNCGSAVYTNLCAPPAGRDLFINCQQIDEQHTPTTWFAYETNSGGRGPSQLSFSVGFDDSRSQVTNGTLPFELEDLNVSYTLSVWRACETLLQTPLLCEAQTGTLSGAAGSLQFPLVSIAEDANVTFTDKKLRPHTKYYVALSTAYRGDFALCATETSDIVDVTDAPTAVATNVPTAMPAPACNTQPEAGNCSDVCDITPCDPLASLDALTFVQSFDPSAFSAGDFGVQLSSQLPGIDVVAFGRACQCCREPMLFNTSAPSGDDCELGTPNRRYGGPGCGAGGAEGDGANFNDEGLCLIVSEDTDFADPDSLRHQGVVLSISFCNTVQLRHVVFINAQRGTRMTLFDSNGENYPEIPMRLLGPNSVYNRSFDDTRYAAPFISKMEIEFGKGGACIAEFAYRIVGLNDACGCANATLPDLTPPATVNEGAGACCVSGGTECFDYPDRVVCDTVKRGRWFPGRACAEGNVCPHTKAEAGTFWGWQFGKHPVENAHDLKNKFLSSSGRDNWGYSRQYNRRMHENYRHHHQQDDDDDEQSSSSSSSSP